MTQAPFVPYNVPKNAKPIINGLQNTMNNLGQFFDTSQMQSTVGNQIEQGISMGKQYANNAASEYTNRTLINGGDASLAGVMRAQSMMPVYEQATGARSELAKNVSQVKQAHGTLKSSLAAQIGELKNSYLQSLQGYNTKMIGLQDTRNLEQQKLSQQQGQFDALHALNKDKFAFDQRQQATTSQLQAAGLLKQLGPVLSNEQTDWSLFKGWDGMSPTRNVAPQEDPQTAQLRQLLTGMLG